MADIDVVPKHRSHAWIWIVIAIIIALLIWAFAAHHASNATGQLHVHPGFLAYLSANGGTLTAV